ncbi:N-acetylmuramoyl-L-alanine amidase [Rhizobium ruizarguesonis]|uniref:N-acetylmuramoyl-L-alanine amidase n=1 Tax=Rhizobium ruizarguesonis TaxID=2081791 RepID=UPI000949A8D8|nr:N-acetylmuramoyl-L-alanine amidase [Rhizobium ruizarguesonis]UED34241.1 N-acetylmuramoyl-L-alanine amidase [Rhizobium ruizarguesonis]
MKRMCNFFSAAVLGYLLVGGVTFAQEAEESKISSSSQEFVAAGDTDLAKLEASELSDALETGELAAMSPGEFDKLVAEIKAYRPIAGVDVGKTDVRYDIIVQPGHYLRTKGALGTSGKKVSEQQLVAYIVRVIATQLSAGGLKVLVVPADGVTTGLTSKVFLSVHADGSLNACKIGPSLSYQKNSSLMAMHAVGFALSRAFGYEYEDFMKDNYTVDEAKYYMFSKVNTEVMKGLLEVGELTCVDSENRLITTSTVVGKNVAAALKYIATAELADK